MASLRKRGKSYQITVSCGYDSAGEKIAERCTWTPPDGMKPGKIEKELDTVAHNFEAKVKRGHYLDGEKITFAEFVKTWYKDFADKQLKPKTLEGYRFMLDGRIIPAIGHHILAKLQPAILIKFMNALQEAGLNENVRHQAKPGIRGIWKKSGLRVSDADLSKDTLTSILSERHVSLATADKFSRALKTNLSNLFDTVGKPKDLSANTVGHYMRCISTILSTAVAWQLIESNPCERVRSPKMIKKQIKYLEIDETQNIIEAALKLDNIRIQTAILVFLYTGIRKSELSGLRWSDIDFKNGLISINRIVQQIDGQGLITSTPKTDSGERSISISADLVSQLRKHRARQAEEQLRMGDRWQIADRLKADQAGERWQPVDWVFTAWNGKPLHPSTVYHWIKQFLIDNGQPDMTVHGLRHTNISILLSQGVDLITVSKRAGHAKPSITADIYAHALKKPDEDAADKLNDLFRPSFKDSV